MGNRCDCDTTPSSINTIRFNKFFRRSGRVTVLVWVLAHCIATQIFREAVNEEQCKRELVQVSNV